MALIDDLRSRHKAPSAEPSGELADYPPGHVPTAAESQAQLEAQVNAPLDSPIDKAAALLGGVVGAIPGGKYASAKIASLLGGGTEQEAAHLEGKLEHDNPLTSLGGNLAGAAGTGVGALPEAAGGAVAKLAGNAAINATLEPIYKLGEIANQAQLQADPLHVEQIANAFSLTDILEAGGLGAIAGVPALGMEAAAGAKSALRGAAEKSAGDLFTKAATKLGLSTEEAGAMALDKGLLQNRGNIAKLTRQAGKQIEESVKSATIDGHFREILATKLEGLAEQAGPITTLSGATKTLTKQAAALRAAEDLDGPQLQSVISGLRQEARAAYTSKRAQKGQLFNDAAQVLRDSLADHLDVVAPEAGTSYRQAVEDYRIYSTMTPEAVRGADAQVGAKDVGKAALRAGAGAAVGGPVGALAAEAATGGYTARGILSRNSAVLLNRMSEMAPNEIFNTKAAQALKVLISPNSVMPAETVAHEDTAAEFERTSNALRHSLVDPTGTARKIRSHLGFLPPQHADAVTANTMNKLQYQALDIPQSDGPATAFGSQTGVSDRVKREFLRRTHAAFNPFSAIESGRGDLIKHAEKFNPNTVDKVRQMAVSHLSENQDMDYLTKRRVSAILGIAGTPTQDPVLGNTLQQIIHTKHEANSQAGQMQSAKQANASMKNNQATFTRAQRILNDTGGGQ